MHVMLYDVIDLQPGDLMIIGTWISIVVDVNMSSMLATFDMKARTPIYRFTTIDIHGVREHHVANKSARFEIVRVQANVR